MLKFSQGNAKLGKDIFTFSIPAGYTCPFAKDCFSKADKETGKIQDGPSTEFRCYSASLESVYPVVRKQRWENFALLKGLSCLEMADLIQASVPKKAQKVRIHVGGDFFSQSYFDAWMTVAKRLPNIIFYAYTKSLGFWVRRLDEIPANFVLTASKGGKMDALISAYGLRHCEVVYTEQEAIDKGLEIDHDDSHAYTQGPSFALLIHGVQPKGSKAAKAKSALKGKGSYGKGNK